MIGGYEVHPLADLFPLLEGDAFESLVEDIREHGLRRPGLVWRGVLVDGRNRARACEAADVPFRVENVDAGEEELFGLVMGENLRRRQMTVGQLADLAVDLIPMFKDVAKERQREGARQTNAALGRGAETLSADLHKASADAAAWAAKVVGCSRRAVYNAQKLRAEAPSVVKAITRGDVSQNAGITVAKAFPTPEAQEKVARRLRKEVVAEVAKAAPPSDATKVVDEKAEEIEREVAKRLAEEARKVDSLRLARENKDQAKVKKERKRAAELAARADAARQAGATVDGVDLRLGSVEDLILDEALKGALLFHFDPPWDYDVGGRGSARNHYQTNPKMAEFVDLMNQAYDLAADDSVLLVWVTAPHHPNWLRASGPEAMKWEEFTPGYWIKTHTGLGGVWRGQAEILCMYRKGNPKPFQREAFANVYESGRGRHSEKPVEWLTELVDALAPEGALVVDFYAGLAPLARACHATGRRYVGAEMDPARHSKALDLLAVAATPQEAA